MSAGAPLPATWRVVTASLGAGAGDEVAPRDAALAARRLEALDDAVFEGIVARMAAEDGGTWLRRLAGGVDDAALAAIAARLARTASARTARACLEALGGAAPLRERFLAALARAPLEDARRFRRALPGA